MALNRRSQLITAGVARSPNRAMLRAVGFGDGDFVKPIVGVANGHSNMNPCNAGIQPLVDRAMAALRQEGAMPQVFGVPTITDGIGMGTEAMKYSLVSREVIADAIETSVNGQAMDGVLVCGGCDKNMPAGMIAMARINVPGIYVYAGTIKPGKWKGQDLTVVSVFEAVGAGIVILGGTMYERQMEGVELFKEGYAPRVFLMREIQDWGEIELIKRGMKETTLDKAKADAAYKAFVDGIPKSTQTKGGDTTPKTASKKAA